MNRPPMRSLPSSGLGLARRLLGRRAAAAHDLGPQATAAPDSPHCSVLDVGSSAARGALKALVVEAAPSGAIILGAAVAYRPDGPKGRDDAEREPFPALVALAERALEAAEDAAGVVPRRVVVGLGGLHLTLCAGQAAVRRPRPATPLTRDEVVPLLTRAQRAAATAAQRQYIAEYPAAGNLQVIHTTVTSVTLDGRHVFDPAGLTGEHFSVAVSAALAPAVEARRAAELAEALDLELAGITTMPHALGSALRRGADGPALLVDVGAEVTTVTLAGAGGAEAAATFPLGGQALEARLVQELGLGEDDARNAVAAHTAGAPPRGPRFGSGAAAARAVRQLAQHHAEVWLDALELVCAEQLARGRTLPPRLLLCGGAAGLPELRLALAESSWQVTLPFERRPAIRLLSPADVPGVEDRSAALPALQAVPPLCLAAVAAGAAPPATGLDPLLEPLAGNALWRLGP